MLICTRYECLTKALLLQTSLAVPVPLAPLLMTVSRTVSRRGGGGGVCQGKGLMGWQFSCF
jgi:hypothetical protein